MDIIHKGIVKLGKIEFKDQDRFDKCLLGLAGQEVEVIVRKPKRQRSNNQNAYMWGVVYQLISETTGYTPDEVHSAMGLMFLLDRSRNIPIVKSTTSLSTVEMENYLESIRQWAAKDLSCSIPLPREIDYTGEEFR
jgi:hypothetical protein